MDATFDESRKFADCEREIHEAAIRAAGCDDFGEPTYLEGMRRWLEALDCEAKLHPQGRQATYQGLVTQLRLRLRAQRLLREHAATLQREIRRPLIVVGLVRTGSTALHHLLAQDPDAQVLEYWVAQHPQPRPPRAGWEQSPDFRESAAEIEGMYQFDPSLRGVHLMAPDLAEECRHLLAQSFTDDAFEVNATVPSYTRWYETADHVASYRRHRELLRLIGSTSPEKRWTLKYSPHMKFLRAVLEVYPDACIVWTHRDPSRVLSSYVSLIAGFQAIFERDIDRAAIAREQAWVWSTGADRAIEVRARHDPAQFYDLHFRDFVADPLSSIRRIYDHFGFTLSAEGERRMRGWIAANPQGKHGKHEHSLESVGLSREEILAPFAGYMRHFDMQPE